ncbi:MAG: DUF268 domain-containing protein [Gammaproteobacteria bacterium]
MQGRLNKLGTRLMRPWRRWRRYRSTRKQWLAQGGYITHHDAIMKDSEKGAGVVAGAYFHQDLLVAELIHEARPERHIDVGSRIDGFVAHVAAFREIEVLDIRPLAPTNHPNIRFVQADVMEPVHVKQADSVSCLHAIEHFGMGRYGDDIRIDGHLQGIASLIQLLSEGGTLYLSFPIGVRDEVHFNAQRVFHPDSVFAFDAVQRHLKLKRFDFVDDAGALRRNARPEDAYGQIAGCGIYTFTRVAT